VTHPSATRNSYQLSENSFKGSPFDLHVLSTPPAFILSQDQTLNKMVSKERLRSLNHLIEALTKLQRNLKSLLQAFACQKDSSSFLVLHVSLTLFNLQGTRSASRLAGVLFIIALRALLVKNFFQVFS